MRNIASRLIRLRDVYPGDTERSQAHRLLIVNSVWLAVVIVTGPVALLAGAVSLGLNTETALFPLTLVIAALVHQLVQQGRVRLAQWAFVLNVLAVALLSIFPGYRLDTPFIVLVSLPLTAAGVLLRRAGVLSVAAAIAIAVAVGGAVQMATDMEASSLGSANDSIGATVALVALVVLLNAGMLVVFTGNAEGLASRQRRLSRWMDASARISESLVSLPAPGEALNLVVEQIREAFDLYHIQVFMTDPLSGLATMRASTGFIGRRLLEEDSLLTPEESSPVNDALRRKDPLLIGDNASESQRAGFLPATRSELLIPLRVGDMLPIGVLDLHSTRPDEFSPELRRALSAIAHHLAAALYAVEQGKDLREGYAERDRLIAEVDAVRHELARTNRQLVSTTWGAYLQERAQAVPGFGWQGGEVQPLQEPSETVEETLSDGQPRLIQREGHQVLCLPIRLRGMTLGAVEFQRAGSSAWSPAAEELAQAVADRLALSLENARLFEQAQVTAQREQLVSQVASRLQASNDLQALLTRAAAEFQDALGATHTQVRLGVPMINDDSEA